VTVEAGVADGEPLLKTYLGGMSGGSGDSDGGAEGVPTFMHYEWGVRNMCFSGAEDDKWCERTVREKPTVYDYEVTVWSLFWPLCIWVTL